MDRSARHFCAFGLFGFIDVKRPVVLALPSAVSKSLSQSLTGTGRGILVALLLAVLAVRPAAAQLGDEIPHAGYFVATAAFYSGDYRDAERGLRLETRRGVRTTQARWIDAICYHAMLGEVLYHQGRNAEALAEFDQACQVLLAYPDWLLQVKFQQAPRPDTARARRPPPWGQSQRNATLGQFSTTEQVFIGELDASRVLRQGGVFQPAMFWRVNVVEIIRASALAIRRRGELLGPLATHDRITKDLSDVFARGNLSPANHWSMAWIDLLRGLTQAGIGKLNEADMLLGRAVTVDGQFDHPLTCVALLEQGRVAMARGDSRRAATLFAEAGFSAYSYENWDALCESVWLGWINHLASNAPGVYAPLEPVVAWAQANRLQHIATKLRLARAESLLWLGQLEPAGVVLDEAARRIGALSRGLSGIHFLYLQANLQLLSGEFAAGSEILSRALGAQAGASLRNFQIYRTNEMYDSRAVSPRIAVDLYGSLLTDPRPSDWLSQPLDAMAVLGTAHDAALDRWFVAALERKDSLLALEIAEKSKRRRFLATLPLGGRLLALRTILEAPEQTLSRDAVLERQQLLALFPMYRQLSEAGAKLQETLRAGPVLVADGDNAKALAAQYDAWGDNTARRQQLLMQLAGRRLQSSLEFPPQRKPNELQEALAGGEALVVFHAAGGTLYGFLLTNKDIHLWQLDDGRRLSAGVGELLQALGNFGANRTLTAAELNSDNWRKIAAEAFTAIFAAARLDLAKTKMLTIVPDDVLWYLPFDALIPDAAEAETTLAELVPIRYGPTAALAVSRSQPLRRPQNTGIVANDVQLGGDSADAEELLEDLEQAAIGPVRIPSPLPQPAGLVTPLLDGLVVLDEVESDRMSASGWLPLPRSRGAASGAVDADLAPVNAAPESVVVTGFATAAERGLKPSRRGAARNMRPGSEVFHALSGMMAGGARTILLSRWRSGGRTNLELVRQFVQELSHLPATEAWQRACILAREEQLDPQNEPRLKGLEASDELPTADHPFFWSGYLLVDTGPRVEEPADKEQAETIAGGDVVPANETPNAKPVDEESAAKTHPDETDDSTTEDSADSEGNNEQSRATPTDK
jgi:hypothetical protein